MKRKNAERNQLNFFAYAKFVSRSNFNKKILIFIFVAGVLFLGGCGNKNNPDNDIQKNIERDRADALREKSAITKPVKILFVGDMMFDRYIRTAVGKYGEGNYDYVLEPLKEKLAEYDLIVANLEGPVTDKNSVSAGTAMDEKRNLIFTFDPAVAGALAENNIKLVNLGNNHILNQGENGLAQTKKYLGEAGVQYFGDTGGNDVIASEAKQSRGNNSNDEIAAVATLPRNDKIINIRGVKIGFINYNYSVVGSFDKAIQNIHEAKSRSDVVIACPHWGTEYKTGDPGREIRSEAHTFIDAGADAVIGGHPHVIQSSKEYNGKKIYYSLGNFVFDQYFQKETMEGLGVEMTINLDLTTEFSELKFEMTKRGQTIFKVEP